MVFQFQVNRDHGTDRQTRCNT